MNIECIKWGLLGSLTWTNSFRLSFSSLTVSIVCWRDVVSFIPHYFVTAPTSLHGVSFPLTLSPKKCCLINLWNLISCLQSSISFHCLWKTKHLSLPFQVLPNPALLYLFLSFIFYLTCTISQLTNWLINTLLSLPHFLNTFGSINTHSHSPSSCLCLWHSLCLEWQFLFPISVSVKLVCFL